MYNGKITSLSFLISFVGHLSLFGMSFSFFHIMDKDLQPLKVEIVIPADLPQVKQIAEKKELVTKQEMQQSMLSDVVNQSVGALEVIDNYEEEMLRYQDMAKQKIQEEKRYPRWAQKHRFTGKIQIDFVVLANGSIRGLKAISLSGFPILDQEALATVKRAAPFLPFPVNWNIASLPMRVTIVFVNPE